MKVAIPIHGDRISPVFDVARQVEVLEIGRKKEITRCECRIETTDPIDKTKRIIAVGTNVLICGAISRPLELMLVSHGVRVIANTCGLAEEVMAAFVAGNLTRRSFLMPGCKRHRGRRYRHGNRQRSR